MGTWGPRPWENDAACDWFDELFQSTQLHEYVRQTLELEAERSSDEICAAAFVLCQLGEGYIWPSESLEACLELAQSKLSKIIDDAQLEHGSDGEFIASSVKPQLEAVKLRLAQLRKSDPD